MTSLNSYYSGISGLQLPVPKYNLPAEFQSSSRLHYYSTLFNSIEINSTFYKLPKAPTVAKWERETTEGFEFTFKLWKQITHNKGLEFNEEDVKQFFAVVNSAGQKRGCILIQFPASLQKQEQKQLHKLLKTIRNYDRSRTWKMAVEFRHRSWYVPQIFNLLNRQHMTMVMHDKANSATPFLNTPGDYVYLRFHGPQGNYRGNYSEDLLAEYAEYIREWRAEGKKVYVYFNNTLG